MRFFLLGELTVVLVIGFFFFFTLPLYFGSSKFIFNGDPWKNDTGPYPSYHAQNLFWFLQVTIVLVVWRQCSLILLPAAGM